MNRRMALIRFTLLTMKHLNAHFMSLSRVVGTNFLRRRRYRYSNRNILYGSLRNFQEARINGSWRMLPPPLQSRPSFDELVSGPGRA